MLIHYIKLQFSRYVRPIYDSQLAEHKSLLVALREVSKTDGLLGNLANYLIFILFKFLPLINLNQLNQQIYNLSGRNIWRLYGT